jgi:Domain of unknown function (DUF4062)
VNPGSFDTPVIRTPDQRLRVFVSSTLIELANERQAARAAISALGLTPVMFEQGARPHPPRDVYRAYLSQSDVFVGLYWQSYGRIPSGMETSGLEEEFELSHDLPRLLYSKPAAIASLVLPTPPGPVSVRDVSCGLPRAGGSGVARGLRGGRCGRVLRAAAHPLGFRVRRRAPRRTRVGRLLGWPPRARR